MNAKQLPQRTTIKDTNATHSENITNHIQQTKGEHDNQRMPAIADNASKTYAIKER